MIERLFAIVGFTAAVLIAACASSSLRAAAVTSGAYQCGPQRVSIALAGDHLTLKTATDQFALQRVLVASGAKFASPSDERTYFWDSGAVALLSLRGVVYPECTRETVSTPAASSPTLLIGSEWTVVEIGNRGIIAHSPTLIFGEDGRVSGDTSCNNFNAPYMLKGANLSFGHAVVTRRACITEGVMEQEGRFLDIFGKVARFEIASSGELILHTDDGRTMRARR